MLFHFFFLLFASIAQAQPVLQCEGLLTATSTEIFSSPLPYSQPFFYKDFEWKRVSVRDPSEKILNDDYLYRSFQSVVRIFGPWFSKEGPLQGLPLTEVMRMQHIVLVTEETGGAPYVGATLIAHGREPTPLIAGQYRSESHRALMEGHAMSYRIDAKLPDLISPHLAAMRDWYRRSPSPNKVIEPKGDFPDPIFDAQAIVDTIRLPRLQERVRIWNEVIENYITHHYPASRDVPFILEAMDQVMNELRQRSDWGSKKKKSWPVFIRTLTEYLYLGIHAHPFESGNFSLIMSQVNYVLMKNQFRGLSHENLDYLGLSVPFEEFLRTIETRILALNPNNSRVAYLKSGTHSRRTIDLNITAHISERGDVRFRDGAIVEDLKLRQAIEGIYIVPPGLPQGVTLEYRGRVQTDGETGWLQAGNFLGTWGQRKALESIAFRLIGPGSERLDVYYQIRSGDREWIAECRNGMSCESSDKSKPITALIVKVRTRSIDP